MISFGHKKRIKKEIACLLFLLLAAALVGCSSDSSNDEQPSEGATTDGDAGDQVLQLFSAARDPGYSVGVLERVTLDGADVVSDQVAADGSDIRVASDGSHVYLIGRSQLNSITKYAVDDLTRVVYQRSVAGDDVDANPYQIAFADSNKAYVVRFGSNRVWIIDPQADSDDGFKTGELDLSAYSDADGNADPVDAVVVDGKLFVLIARLDSSLFFAPTLPSYVAVFDIATDTEIDTTPDVADDLNGIELTVHNGAALDYVSENGFIYVSALGDAFGLAGGESRFTGGIETIDPQSYEHTLILDDGDATGERFVGHFEPLSASRGYVSLFDTFANDQLRSMNLITDDLGSESVAGVDGIEITTLTKGPGNQLWVGFADATQPGFMVVDPENDSQVARTVNTSLIPQNVVFFTSDTAASD